MNTKISILGLSFMAILSSSNLYAESKPSAYTDCGIGATLFENDTGAAISNVIWDLGSTALTSASASADTCKGFNPDAAKFIEKSYDRLVEETAQGKGNHLDTLMNIVKVSSEKKEQVVTTVRAHMAAIVASSSYLETNKVEKINIYYSTFMEAVNS